MKIKIITPTPFGPVVLIWFRVNEKVKIIRILLSRPDLSAEDQLANNYPHYEVSSCGKIDSLSAKIRDFLEGKDVKFSLDVVALDSCPPFQKAVLRAEHQIPRGKVSTYKLIARYLGKENGARAVGNALAKNPFPIIIPCHRAIRSDGYLGGFQGGMDMKQVLLENEGFHFDVKGRVIVPRFHYD